MSPTVFRAGGFRFYFFSREEPRIHVHGQSADGEAKFWLEPAVELAVSYNLKEKDLTKVRQLVEEHKDEIRAAWNAHFKR
ncbi:MAG: DUF4160 domain-containing protein [Planctomycetaceae bacterium]